MNLSALLTRRTTRARCAATVLTRIGTAILAMIGSQGCAVANSVSINRDDDLSFGQFAVVSSGSRTVSASGVITNSAVFPVGATLARPARFTIKYDRSKLTLLPTMILQLQLSGGQLTTKDGVQGAISYFDTDLPGIGTILPGSLISFTLPTCQQHTCTQSFRVGGKLDVSRTSGGATLQLPIAATVIVIAAF